MTSQMYKLISDSEKHHNITCACLIRQKSNFEGFFGKMQHYHGIHWNIFCDRRVSSSIMTRHARGYVPLCVTVAHARCRAREQSILHWRRCRVREQSILHRPRCGATRDVPGAWRKRSVRRSQVGGSLCWLVLFVHHHSCHSTSRALPMPGTADGDAISRCQVSKRLSSRGMIFCRVHALGRWW